MKYDLRYVALFGTMHFFFFFFAILAPPDAASNNFKKLPSDATDFVLERASVCLTRITETFSLSNQLDKLCIRGLLNHATSLISISCSRGGQASLGTSTYTDVVSYTVDNSTSVSKDYVTDV
ncbi:hypothetical protein HanPSC8_Chr17g0777011 [Helianthus annuus]|nr:hypothetical protein HanPSC8_Chr17g0777011 [Helianthus annuus]